MKKILLIAIVVALAVMGVVLWRGGQAQHDNSGKPVVKIGIIYPMSGNAAFMGEAAKKSAEIFFNDFDKSKAKFDYELIFEDSQANPAKGVMAAKKLIEYDHVDVLVDCVSNVSNAVSRIAEEHKVPHIAFAQDKSISDGFYNYRVVTSAEKTGEKMLQALKRRNIKKVVAIVSNNAGSLSLFSGFEKFTGKGKDVEVVETYYVNPGEKDFKLLLQKIKQQQNVGAIVVSAQSPETDIVLKQIKENGIEIPVTAIQSFTFLKDKSLADGSWYVDVAFTNKAFYDKYHKFTGEKLTNFAENMYAVLQVITNNFETQKVSENAKPDAENFIKNMKSANGINSPIGILKFNKKEQNVDSEASVRLIRNGKVELSDE